METRYSHIIYQRIEFFFWGEGGRGRVQFIVGFGIVDNIRDWSISSLKEGDKREGGGGAGRVQLQFSCTMRACTSNHSDKLTPPPEKGIILYQKIISVS